MKSLSCEFGPIDLRKFCATAPPWEVRRGLYKYPQLHRSMWYATDGRVVVRVRKNLWSGADAELKLPAVMLEDYFKFSKELEFQFPDISGVRWVRDSGEVEIPKLCVIDDLGLEIHQLFGRSWGVPGARLSQLAQLPGIKFHGLQSIPTVLRRQVCCFSFNGGEAIMMAFDVREEEA